MLTNKKDGKITINELEVWEVTGFIDENDQFVKYEAKKKIKNDSGCKN